MTPDDLLLQVLLSPGDESLRAVYVDQLLERGDPRGEHARLLRQGRAEEAEQLVRTHGASWLPPTLARLVVAGSERFRDGLLEACALRPMTGHDAQQLAAEPLWSAVRALHSPPYEVITQSTSLEALTGVDDALLATLGGWKTKLPRLQHLGLRVNSHERAVETMLRDLELPSLTRLSVQLINEGENARRFLPDPVLAECCEDCARPSEPRDAPSFRPQAWAALFASKLGAQLKTLEFHAGWVDLAKYVEALEGTRCDAEVVRLRGAEEATGVPGWSLALLRTAPGRYRSLELETQDANDDEAEDLRAMLVTRPAWLSLTGELARRAKRLAPEVG
ncbi:MAG: hypothetical protein QM817_25845 [Archangium sp.]